MHSRTLRRGMTVIELLVVLTVVSAMSLMAATRFKGLTERSALRSARQHVEAAVSTARSAAIQKGRRSTFYISGNTIGVRTVINDAGAVTQTLRPMALDSALGVKIKLNRSSDSVITFDSRGFASPRLPSTAVYGLVRGSRTDSTCISIVGMIIGQGCVQ